VRGVWDNQLLEIDDVGDDEQIDQEECQDDDVKWAPFQWDRPVGHDGSCR
jgi:hypothetical protein